MKFQLTVQVEVPDHIAATMPQAPDLQQDLKHLIDASIAAAIEVWADSRVEPQPTMFDQVFHLQETEPGVYVAIEPPPSGPATKRHR